ncbi:hypothetical protein ACFVH6_22145 [Spirillospora sp. NPDC127200]
MNVEETAKVVAEIALYDNRESDPATVAAWHRVIGDLDYDETLAAVVGHFRDSTEYLKPAHIRQRVKAARAARITAAGTLAQHQALHGAEPATEADYRRALREIQARIGDGDEPQPPPFKAIDAPRPGTQVPASYAQLRANWDAERAELRQAEAAERARRLAEADAERAERRRVTDAYGLLLTLTPDAQAHAYARATAELGEHTDRDTLTVRAAELADHTQTAALPADLAETLSPAAATARRLARIGCPNGCEIGTHEPACTHYAAFAAAAEEDR